MLKIDNKKFEKLRRAQNLSFFCLYRISRKFIMAKFPPVGPLWVTHRPDSNLEFYFLWIQCKNLHFTNYLRLRAICHTILQNDTKGSKRSWLPQGHSHEDYYSKNTTKYTIAKGYIRKMEQRNESLWQGTLQKWTWYCGWVTFDLKRVQRPACFAPSQRLALHSFQNNWLYEIHKSKNKRL